MQDFTRTRRIPATACISVYLSMHAPVLKYASTSQNQITRIGGL